MPKYQVVERDDYGMSWAAVRYNNQSAQHYNSEAEGIKVAIDCVTDRNCNNALAREEKLNAIEAFMMRPDGVFLGVLDGKDWYLTYQKSIKLASGATAEKGDIVQDPKWYQLEGKTEIAVRIVPGT